MLHQCIDCIEQHQNYHCTHMNLHHKNRIMSLAVLTVLVTAQKIFGKNENIILFSVNVTISILN